VAFSSSALFRAVRCRLATSFHAAQVLLVASVLAGSVSRPRLSVFSCASSSLALPRRYCSSSFCRCVEFLGLCGNGCGCAWTLDPALMLSTGKESASPTSAIAPASGGVTGSRSTAPPSPSTLANHASKSARKSPDNSAESLS
jgi:hypothetical protein